MRHSKHCFAFFLTVSLIILFPVVSQAYNVTPMIIELSGESGETYTGSFEVDNSGGNAVEPIRIYMEDWDRSPDGEFVNMMAGSLERSCSSWLSLSPTQVDVPLHGMVEIKYTLRVPKNASGSYWTYIMVEGVSKPTEPPSGKEHVQVFIGAKIRYAVRFVVNITAGSRTEGEISEISIAPTAKNDEISAVKELQVKIVFNNKGNTFVKPVGFLEIKSIDGETVLKKDIEQFYVFPNRDKWIIALLDKTLPPGEYVAFAVLDYGGDNLVAGELHFEVDEEGDIPGKRRE